MTNVMLDLETYGTAPGCPVLAIGAVIFGGSVGLDFYGVAKVDQREWGLVPAQTTVDWWAEQSEVARAIFSSPEAVTLPELLAEFAVWLPGDAFVWGNGAGFDQPILTAAYRAVKSSVPWKFYNERCYRTMKNLAPQVEIKRVGEHHNALDDARSQAEHLMRIYEALGLQW